MGPFITFQKLSSMLLQMGFESRGMPFCYVLHPEFKTEPVPFRQQGIVFIDYWICLAKRLPWVCSNRLFPTDD